MCNIFNWLLLIVFCLVDVSNSYTNENQCVKNNTVKLIFEMIIQFKLKSKFYHDDPDSMLKINLAFPTVHIPIKIQNELVEHWWNIFSKLKFGLNQSFVVPRDVKKVAPKNKYDPTWILFLDLKWCMIFKFLYEDI